MPTMHVREICQHCMLAVTLHCMGVGGALFWVDGDGWGIILGGWGWLGHFVGWVGWGGGALFDNARFTFV